MKRIKRLGWYIQRLRAMSPAEMAYRLQLKLKEPLTRRAIRSLHLPHSLSDILSSSSRSIGWIPLDPATTLISDDFLDTIRYRADKVCAHTITLFNRQISLGPEIDWYRDYIHDRQCPRRDYARLDYRIPEETGDIMPIWWLNRHQHLMPAAIAYFFTREPRYADEVLLQIESWLEQCPYPVGPGWLTGIEAGVRLLTWSWLFRFLFAHGRPKNCSDSLLVSWFTSIMQHAAYISRHKARFSSANNHAVAETVGLLAAVTTWPLLFDSNYSVNKLSRKLIRTIQRQVSEDGVHLEQSTSYHAFVLELMVNAAVLHEPSREKLEDSMHAMADFLNTLLGDNDIAPDLSDADYAVATGIFQRSHDYYRNVVRAAQTLCGAYENEHCAKVSSPVSLYTGSLKAPLNKAGTGDFSTGGYVVWKGIMTDRARLKLCMDVGPLGFGALAAHGHADALSFTLDVNDEQVFVDPGTYAYHDEPLWRRYFKSTRAHNTIVINGEDQAENRGPFLWGQRYTTHVDHVVMSEDQFDVAAEHSGYYHKGLRVIHHRTISCHPMSKRWDIHDQFPGNGTWSIELLFHVHPERTVEQIAGSVFKITGGSYEIILTLTTHLRCRVAMGETDPPLGWFSPVLGEKVPCPVICGEGTIIGSDNLFTSFTVNA